MWGLGEFMGVKIHLCIGGTLFKEDQRKFDSGVQIVVGTPGRVLDVIKRSAMSTFFKPFLLNTF